MKNFDGTASRADRLAGLFAPAIVDIFAGCGGWSIGQEQAFVDGGYRDKYIDLMINHWDVAVGVHALNHPLTQHLRANILEVDPAKVLPGRSILHLHASPDCRDHSKAKGGVPRKKEIRALADVVIVWAGKRRPAVITLENVEEFRQWGPLLKNGLPDKRRRGHEFDRWVRELKDLGYDVEWRELRACDYGAPTTRKRLFIIARCDGRPIVWPEATHGQVGSDRNDAILRERGLRRGDEGNRDRACPSGSSSSSSARDQLQSGAGARKDLSRRTTARVGRATETSIHSLKPYRTAADCINWDIPMLSIFATRNEARAWTQRINEGKDKYERIGVPQRPLKINTQKRLAGGLFKWVLNSSAPFLVRVAHGEQSPDGTKRWGSPTHSIDEPLPTVAGTKDFAVADVQLGAFHSTLNHGGDEHRSNDLREPFGTVVGANEARGVVGAQIAPFTAGPGGRAAQSAPTSCEHPLPTVTGKADRIIGAAQVAPFTVPRYGEREGQAPRSGSVETPLPTVTGTDNGAQLAVVALNKHFTGVVGQSVDRPLDTVTSVDHNSLLAVHLTNYHSSKGDEVRGQGIDEPIKTLDTNNRYGPVAAHIVKFRGDSLGNDAGEPMPTVTSGQGAARDAGAAHALGVSCAYLSKMYGTNRGGGGEPDAPHGTVSASGNHSALHVVYLTPYYGSDSALAGHTPDEPMPTVVGKARFGLADAEVTRHFILTAEGLKLARRVATWARKLLGAKVKPYLLNVQDEAGKVFQLLTTTVRGALHLVTDILMRMLRPRELARAQGFDDSYVIDRTVDGKRLSKADQVKLIGNSVPPAFSRAIVKANIVDQGLLEDQPALAGVAS